MKRNIKYIALLMVCALLLTGCQNGGTASVTSSPSSTEAIISAVTSKVTTSAVTNSKGEMAQSSKTSQTSSQPWVSPHIQERIEPKKVSKMTHDKIIKELELTCGFDLPASAKLLGGNIEFSATETETFAIFKQKISGIQLKFSKNDFADFKKAIKKSGWEEFEIGDFEDTNIHGRGWGKWIGNRKDVFLSSKSDGTRVVNYAQPITAITGLYTLCLMILPNKNANSYTLYLDGEANNERHYKGAVKAVDQKGNVLKSDLFVIDDLPNSLSKWKLKNALDFAEYLYDLDLPDESAIRSAQVISKKEIAGKTRSSLTMCYALKPEIFQELTDQIERYSRWEEVDISKNTSDPKKIPWKKYRNSLLGVTAIFYEQENGLYSVELTAFPENTYGFTGTFTYSNQS